MSTTPATVPIPEPAPATSLARSPRAVAFKLAASRLAWSLVVPAAAAWGILRYLAPAPLEGATGGLVAALGRLANEHPVIVGLALFISVSETLRYWRVRAGLEERVVAADARPRRRARLRLGAGLVAGLVALLAVRSSVVQTYRVDSPSMVPTLDGGDNLLVNKLAYGFKLPFTNIRVGHGKLPRRGDVVVFRGAAASGDAGTGPEGRVVKRVVALPGDRVAFRNGQMVINGWPVPTCDAGPYTSVLGRFTVRGRMGVETLDDRAYLTVWTPGEPGFDGFTVPPGQLFVVGDDRGMSNDSRVWNSRRGGGVPVDGVEGRVSRILIGSRREDGRLDFSRLLAPLGMHVRQPGIDLSNIEQRIADCLKAPPKNSHPPAPTAAP
jgi:signal peptidase I